MNYTKLLKAMGLTSAVLLVFVLLILLVMWIGEWVFVIAACALTTTVFYRILD